MQDPGLSEEAVAQLRSFAHDLRGVVGALGHQAKLLRDGQLPPDVQHRSIAAVEANVAELRRLLAQLDAMTSGTDDAPVG